MQESGNSLVVVLCDGLFVGGILISFVLIFFRHVRPWLKSRGIISLGFPIVMSWPLISMWASNGILEYFSIHNHRDWLVICAIWGGLLILTLLHVSKKYGGPTDRHSAVKSQSARPHRD